MLDQVETGVSETGRSAPNWPRAVLFDLDGTLIDSAPDIAAAVNELLSHSNRGPLTLAEVTSMIGNGVEKLVERAFAATGGALAPAALRREQMAMVDVYANHLTELTVPMPGAIDVLETLHGDGTLLGLVTNKPQRFIETILDHLGMSSLFGHDTLNGVETLFAMFIVATSIVAGQLVANALVAPRRSL